MDPKKKQAIEDNLWRVYLSVIMFACAIMSMGFGLGIFRLCWHYLLCSWCLYAG